MLEQTGVVISTEGDIAHVSFMRASACEGCHRHAEGCSACSMLGGDRRHTARAKNPIGARPGDRVRVATPEGRVLAYAALVFLLPILLSFVGYLVGAGIWGESSLPAGLCAAAGFLLAFLLSILVSARMAKRPPDAEIMTVIN
ncbi:MAG: SoxR reducing system RseC family protein [Clostridia bacterium]|nr:SoxR reducing system RseC family protein [Clostridia bacterium]